MVHQLARIAKFNGSVDFFRFRPEIPFFGEFGLKNQNCQFKPEFGTLTNSNTKNSMVMFIFFVLDRNLPFLANLFEKIKIVNLT